MFKMNRPTSSFKQTRLILGAALAIVAVFLSACGASTPTAIPTPVSTSAPAATDTPAQTAAPTSLDPCQFINSQEASTLAGATFGPGVEETLASGAKTCTYGAQTTNVFMVEVAQAPDVATAQKYKADFLTTLQNNAAQLTSSGLNVTQLPNLGDGAVMAQLSFTLPTGTLNGGAIGVLKGTIFFGFSDEVNGGPAPTADAMQTEATNLLAQLP